MNVLQTITTVHKMQYVKTKLEVSHASVQKDINLVLLDQDVKVLLSYFHFKNMTLRENLSVLIKKLYGNYFSDINLFNLLSRRLGHCSYHFQEIII